MPYADTLERVKSHYHTAIDKVFLKMVEDIYKGEQKDIGEIIKELEGAGYTVESDTEVPKSTVDIIAFTGLSIHDGQKAHGISAAFVQKVKSDDGVELQVIGMTHHDEPGMLEDLQKHLDARQADEGGEH